MAELRREIEREAEGRNIAGEDGEESRDEPANGANQSGIVVTKRVLVIGSSHDFPMDVIPSKGRRFYCIQGSDCFFY